MSHSPPSFEPNEPMRFPSLVFSNGFDAGTATAFPLPALRVPSSLSSAKTTLSQTHGAFSSGRSELHSLIRPVVARQTKALGQNSVSASAWRMESAESTASYTHSPSSGTSSQSSKKRRHYAPEMQQESPTRTGQAPAKPVKSAKRRQQCRTNQARYRERQKAKLWMNEEGTASLRELVNLLEVQRSFMRTGGPPRSAFVQHVVVEFFNRFRAGLAGASSTDIDNMAGDVTAEPSQASLRWVGQSRTEGSSTLLKQIAFIRTVVRSNTDIGDGLRGPDALLEQLWRYSVLYSNLRLELQTIERVVASDSHADRVLVAGRMRGTVTDRTFDMVLPGLSSRLRRKLLGRTLTFSLQLDMEFEEAHDSPLLQVTQLNMNVGTTIAILEMLANTMEVEEVLRCARISLHGFIGDLMNHPGSQRHATAAAWE